MGDGGRERDGDLGGGDGDLGDGDGDLEGGDRDLGWRQGSGDGDRDLGVGIFAYFAKQGEFWERVEGKLVLQGNPHVVVCPCFSVDL